MCPLEILFNLTLETCSIFIKPDLHDDLEDACRAQQGMNKCFKAARAPQRPPPPHMQLTAAACFLITPLLISSCL